MNREDAMIGRSRSLFAPPLLLCLLLTSGSALAQVPSVDEQTSVHAFGHDASLGKTFACPANVPVDVRAVEFKGTVSTTSESGASFQVLVRYGTGEAPTGKVQNGMLEHRNLETNIGAWSVSTSDGATELRLEVTVTNALALAWRAELWGIAPGTVFHVWQTRLNNNLGQNETCTYQIIGTPDLAVNIDRQRPNYVNSETDGFQVPAGKATELCVFVRNVGNFDADTYGVAGGFSSTTGTGGPQPFQIQSVEPSHGSDLTCQIGGQQNSFSCNGSNLEVGEEAKVTVSVLATTTGTGGFSTVTSAPGEQHFENNQDHAGIEVLPEDFFGHIVGRKKGRVPLGPGDFVEYPVDGFGFELLNAGGEVVGHARSQPDGGERGVFRFENLPAGEYAVREEERDNWTPIDPLGGQIVVVVNGGQISSAPFTNEPDSLDWGDLPITYVGRRVGPCPNQCYPTTGFDGAVHAIDTLYSFGQVTPFGLLHEVDSEDNGQPSNGADADDVVKIDDESGIEVDTLLAGGTGQFVLDVFVNQAAVLQPDVAGWIDFDDDGILTYRERIVDTVLTNGSHTVTFPIPQAAVMKYARFRIASWIPDVEAGSPDKQDFASGGFLADGEVEDYYLPPPGIDFGDAPEDMDPERPDIPFGYPTKAASDGARHVTTDVTDFRIGARIDGELEGQPTIEADGDDYDRLYDEDGIRFSNGFVPFETTFEPREPDGVRVVYGVPAGINATIVPLAVRDGVIDAWIDFNGDGDWSDEGEQIADAVEVQGGPFFTPITFSVPADAVPGWTFGRFRYSTEGDLEFSGIVEGGEVEDHLIRIMGDATRVTTLGDSGPGSLRQAIEDANSNTSPDLVYIVYEPAEGVGKAASVIMLESALPSITRPVVVSGGESLVLDGSQAGENASGLILVGGDSGVHGLTIQNFSRHGVNLASGNNTVENNVIVDNTADGVHIGFFEGNRILSNRISNNGGPGIDMGGDGPTVNDDGDLDGVPNRPELTSIVRGSTTITGTLSAAAETTYLLQFFSNQTCDDSGSGEGADLIGGVSVTTDGAGRVDFEATFDQTLAKELAVVATATGPTGTSEFSQCGVVTRVERDPDQTVPTSFRLGANYPNPFASRTTIPFDVSEPAHVRIEVFNSIGQLVNVPVDARVAPGTYRVELAVDSLPSGVYYYRMSTPSVVGTGKMVIIR